MTQNMKLIWMNRALNFVAAMAGVGSVLMAVLAFVGDVVKTLRDSGLVPTKYIGIASALATIGIAAAKIAKTPSQAIAAAVPPNQTKAPEQPSPQS